MSVIRRQLRKNSLLGSLASHRDWYGHSLQVLCDIRWNIVSINQDGERVVLALVDSVSDNRFWRAAT